MNGEFPDRAGRMLPILGEARRHKWIRVGGWSVCLALALLELWSGRYYTDPDGISYLDMSDALLRHNWHLLINPLWSPLYPCLIGVTRWILRPSAYWELPVVHVLNFVIFLGALASFEFLLRQVTQVLGQRRGPRDVQSPQPLPSWIVQLIGYSLFIWSTFVLINGLRRVYPDLLVSMFVYLDAGMVLRLRTNASKIGTFLLLGLALGFGYLAKAILFPMAFVFMGAAFLVLGAWRKGLLPLTLTLVIFAATTAPLLVGISKMVGRPSFGESGSLNYAWHVNGKELLPFYSSRPRPHLRHPINRISEKPSAFEFRQPFSVTYPLYFDPQYWNAGVRTVINLREQLRAISQNLTVFYASLVAPVWGLIGGFLILFFMSPDLPESLRNVVSNWQLLVPGIVAMGLYALVWVEPRYVAPFVVLVWLGLFCGIRLKRSEDSARLGAAATLVITASMILLTAPYVVYHLADPLPVLQGHGGMYYRVAESLNKAGVRPGESVAIIGSGWDGMVWARLARVRIVAQIPPDDVDEFWRADPNLRAEFP